MSTPIIVAELVGLVKARDTWLHPLVFGVDVVVLAMIVSVLGVFGAARITSLKVVHVPNRANMLHPEDTPGLVLGKYATRYPPLSMVSVCELMG
jgi:hypothetical protein